MQVHKVFNKENLAATYRTSCYNHYFLYIKKIKRCGDFVIFIITMTAASIKYLMFTLQKTALLHILIYLNPFLVTKFAKIGKLYNFIFICQSFFGDLRIFLLQTIPDIISVYQIFCDVKAIA